MTPEQIALIETTFERFYPDHYDAFAQVFYDRLFALDPSLRALFPDELHEQRRKLMMTFNMAVHGMRYPKPLIEGLQRLGKSHAAVGVQPEHYDLVGQALLSTLADYLGEEYTPQVADAWTAAYSLIAESMQQGAVAA